MKRRLGLVALGLVALSVEARGQLRVVDGYGAFFGYPIGTASSAQIVHFFGSDAVALDYNIFTGGINKVGIDSPGGVRALFGSTDCTGPAYSEEPGLIPHGTVVTHNPDPFDTVYYSSLQVGPPVDLRSEGFLTPDGVVGCHLNPVEFTPAWKIVTAQLPYVPPPLRVVGP